MSQSDAEFVQTLRETVARVGWGLVGVGAGDDDPTFTYTYGLTPSYGHSEFIIAGLSPSVAGHILNDLGARVRDGDVFIAGERPPEVLANGLTVELVNVDPEHTHRLLISARRIAGGPVQALQVAYPDVGGRLPWEDGYSLSAATQPIWGTPA